MLLTLRDNLPFTTLLELRRLRRHEATNLSEDCRKVNRPRCNNMRFTALVLVMRKSRQVGEMRGVVVAKNQSTVRTLVVIGVHEALATALNIDKFSQVQQGAIQEVDATAEVILDQC